MNALYESPEYLMVDIETTRPTILGKIVQIGIALCNYKEQTSKIIFHSFINEGLTENDKNSWIFGKESVNTTNKHPLTVSQVETEGKSLESIRGQIQSLFDQYPVCAYNVYFDVSHLLLRGFTISKLLPCPMVNMANVMKIPYDKYRYKYPKCEQAYHYLYPEHEYIEIHSAEDDAQHEGLLYNAMLKLGLIQPFRFDYIDIYLETKLETFLRIWTQLQADNLTNDKQKFIMYELSQLIDRIIVKFAEIIKNHTLQPIDKHKFYSLLLDQLANRYKTTKSNILNIINNQYLLTSVVDFIIPNFMLEKIINSDLYSELQ